jgi:hypothetical protein
MAFERESEASGTRGKTPVLSSLQCGGKVLVEKMPAVRCCELSFSLTAKQEPPCQGDPFLSFASFFSLAPPLPLELKKSQVRCQRRPSYLSNRVKTLKIFVDDQYDLPSLENKGEHAGKLRFRIPQKTK